MAAMTTAEGDAVVDTSIEVGPPRPSVTVASGVGRHGRRPAAARATA